MRRLGWLFFTAVLFTSLIAGCGEGQTPGCGSAIRVQSDSAPDFRLPLFQSPGQSLTLSELYAKGPVLLIFWATWCPPCVEEIPVLNQWHETYAESGLQILAVNVEESPAQLEEFVRDYPIHYPVVMDQEGAIVDAYGLVGLPVSVFIAKGGEILYYGFGLPSNIKDLIAHGKS